jgi:glycosyltransferase involved in cell wall biosynthesis
MSLGKPAVVSDYGGNPYMVENMVSGFVVPRANPGALAAALLRLENDRILTECMGEAAYSRYVLKFTAAAMTEKLETLYSNLYCIKIKAKK